MTCPSQSSKLRHKLCSSSLWSLFYSHSHLSCAQIFASGSCFQISLACIPVLIWETMLHIHIAQLATLFMSCLNYLTRCEENTHEPVVKLVLLLICTVGAHLCASWSTYKIRRMWRPPTSMPLDNACCIQSPDMQIALRFVTSGKSNPSFWFVLVVMRK